MRRELSPGLLERLAAGAAGIAPAECPGAQVVEHRAGRDRAVLEYRFEAGTRLFAKRYASGSDALRSFELLNSLAEQGFGPGSPHRVPEPLGCFPDWSVLVLEAAPGRCLAPAWDPDRWDEGLRGAAGWLARLHSLPVDAESAGEDELRGAYRVARRAAEAAARHPEAADALTRLLDELAARAAKAAGSRASSMTHGRYHLDHVYVAPETVTVIDLDRAAVADPAKDVGEFLHRVRKYARRARLGEAAVERATLGFAEAYAARAGAVPAALSYHWSYSIVFTLLRALERDHRKWEQRLAFYRAEFEHVPRRSDALLRLAAAAAA